MTAEGAKGAACPPLRVPRGYFYQPEAPFRLPQISPPEASPFCKARAG
jgi:hypothetical protein